MPEFGFWVMDQGTRPQELPSRSMELELQGSVGFRV